MLEANTRPTDEAEIRGEIAAWALPKEDIPFRLTWDKPIEFDRIEVTVPADMEIVELLNVGEYVVTGDGAVFHEIKMVPNAPIYFGGVVRTRRIPRKLSSLRRIHVRFSYRSKLVGEKTLDARVFRPQVQLIDAPKTITLKSGEGIEIPVAMRYTGFGDIKVKIQGTMGGRRVTMGKSSASETVKRIIKRGLELETKGGKEKGKREEITHESVKVAARQLLDMMEKGTTQAEFLEMTDDLRRIMDSKEYKQALSDAMNARIEDMMVGMVSDLKSKNPSGNVELASPETQVEAPFTASTLLKVRVKYVDALGNKYSPVVFPIRLMFAGRRGRFAIATIPITLRKWEAYPFLNVEKMEIGS